MTILGFLPANVFHLWRRPLRAGLSVLLLLGLGTGAAAYYRMEMQRAERLVRAELVAIGELKGLMTSSWRTERLGDATILIDSPFLNEAVAAWLRSPAPEQAERLRARFRSLQLAYGYIDVVLLDRDGHSSLSLQDSPVTLTTEDRDAVSAALQTGRPVLTPLHREGESAVIRIDVIAPLLSDGHHLGAIVLMQDARKTLYPLLALWPLRGIIGTTSLEAQEDGAAFRISPSRPDGEREALSPRSSATPHDDATIQVLQPVPDSPWRLITEVERDAALATARGQALKTVLAVTSLLALFGASGLMLWQRQQKKIYQTLYAAERQLRDSEERFRLFMDNSPTIAWMKDVQGRLVYVSQALERWIGSAHADWRGKTDAELWPDATARQLQDHDLEVLAANQALQTTETVPGPDGRESHWRVAKFPFRDASGNRYIGGIGLDITAEWQREEALRASEERLSLAQEAGGIAIWDSDLASHRATLSESYRRLFGLPQDAPCGYDDFLGRVHPDDRAAVDAGFKAALSGAGCYEQEFRIVREDDGRVLWVAGKGQVYFSADGRPVRAMGVVYDITQRKQAEERLQCALNETTNERKQLEAVMEALPVGVAILDSEGGYVRSNQAFARIWGGPRPLVRSVADYGAYRAWWVQTGQPVQPEEWASAQAIRTRAPVVGQRLQIERFDGSKAMVQNSAAPVLTGSGKIAGCAIAIMDISESVAQAEALRESERIFRAIGESIDYGVWICTPDGKNTYASESFLRLVGLTQEQCSDFGWGEVLHPEDADRTLATWQECVRSGTQWDIEHRFRGVDGQYHPVLARGVRVLDEDGKVLCWAGINLDISRLKQAEDALRDADRRKDEFLATLAHELRNPLAPICAVLDALRGSGIQDANFLQLREILERQTRQLVRLVDDLLEVSRITRGRIDLQKERCTLDTLIAQALETSQPLIQSASHSVTVTFPPAALQVDGDPVRLTQVFCNLLNNAAKYMATGGTIHVTAERRGDEAVVRITDEGIGIGAEHLGQVFDLFGQVQCNSKLSQGGLGIGLHLVQRLVELHGGRVAAHSAGPGQGSEFTVILPLAAPETPVAPSPAPTLSGPRSGQRVLIVDDNRDAADTLALLVQTLGCATEVAYDGEAALKILPGFKPDVLFTDLGMPRMDGFEVARRIRQSAAGSGVRLVAVSGWGQEEDRRQTREAGFDHHVVKPVDYAELRRLLDPQNSDDGG